MAVAFNLRDYSTRFDAPQLKGKELIGRGFFAAVYEGSKPNTVYKLTCDSQSYYLLCDGVLGVKSRMLPRLVNNFGEVGEVIIGNDKRIETPLYLIEVERLMPLRRGSPNHHIAKVTESISESMRHTTSQRYHFDIAEHALTHEIFQELAAMRDVFPVTMRNLFRKLSDFAANTDDSCVDMHAANFMSRNGELIASDPVCSYRLHHAAWK